MTEPSWIWQQPDWPGFRWDSDRLAPLLRECAGMQGCLLGMASAAVDYDRAEEGLDTLLQNIITSSAIEGEQLNVSSVRSSLARRLGVDDRGITSPGSEGLAELMMDATRGFDQPLTLRRLFTWHCWLFADTSSPLTAQIHIGGLRGLEPMQVVSGRLDNPVVHVEAPPRTSLEPELDAFLTWFASSRHDSKLDPFLRAGIAHLWFVTLHPFDDGNGRITRALTDLAFAQSDHQAVRLYAMSASILEDRAGYYDALEASQKGTLDITSWLEWFLRTLLHSIKRSLTHIEQIIAKSRFWRAHRSDVFSTEQIKVLNRLLDGGARGFEGGISAAQYKAVAKVSKATATRHLSDLLDKGCLVRLPGGGRSTRYKVCPPDTF